jgi:hypothetical protein
MRMLKLKHIINLILNIIPAHLALFIRNYIVSFLLDQNEIENRKIEKLIIVKLISYKHVLSGPLAGMCYPNPMSGLSYIPKLLGIYEKELHPFLDKIITSSPKLIVNIGSADGYYSIGMARVCSNAQIISFDTCRYARTRYKKNVSVNKNVKNQLTLFDLCTHQSLQQIIEEDETPVVICDIEGGEKELLDPLKVPHLFRSILLVELHDIIVPKTRSILEERFHQTHDLTFIDLFRKNSFKDMEIPLDLDNKFTSSEKIFMVNEHRSGSTGWLYATPK